MRPFKIMKMMNSREIEYIDMISFKLNELSAIVDVVDEKCNAGGSLINDYFDMQKGLNSLIEKISVLELKKETKNRMTIAYLWDTPNKKILSIHPAIWTCLRRTAILTFFWIAFTISVSNVAIHFTVGY